MLSLPWLFFFLENHMILAIGGPMTEKPGKKPDFAKSKPRKIGGIGGEYAKEDPDEYEGPGMDNEEKMLEAARPMARAMGVSSQVVVDAVTTICNLMNNQSGEAEPAESEEESE